MSTSADEGVERVRDEGQWFERGVRVDYFRTGSDARELSLEKAALGAYEVLDCKRIMDGGKPWLEVSVQRIAPMWSTLRGRREISR